VNTGNWQRKRWTSLFGEFASYDILHGGGDDDDDEEEEEDDSIEKRNKLYTLRKMSTVSSIVQIFVYALWTPETHVTKIGLQFSIE
jgi:hypothetical protein